MQNWESWRIGSSPELFSNIKSQGFFWFFCFLLGSSMTASHTLIWVSLIIGIHVYGLCVCRFSCSLLAHWLMTYTHFTLQPCVPSPSPQDWVKKMEEEQIRHRSVDHQHHWAHIPRREGLWGHHEGYMLSVSWKCSIQLYENSFFLPPCLTHFLELKSIPACTDRQEGHCSGTQS